MVTTGPVKDRDPDVIERIKRQCVAKVISLGIDATNVQRWNRAGNDAQPVAGDMPDVWAVLTFGDQDPNYDDSPIGSLDRELPVTIDLHLLKIPTGHSDDSFTNAWVAAVMREFLADPNLVEDDTDTELAIDVRFVGSFGPDTGDQGRDVLCGVELTILCRIDETDPYTLAH